jgi:hypothetical protein
MPNICECILELRGTTDADVAAFVAENTRIEDNVLTLDFTRAMPLDDDSRNKAMQVWGTTSNAWSVSFRDNVFQFDTAWAAPLKWLRRVAALYPQIAFRLDYEQTNDGFKGFMEIHVANNVSTADEWELDTIDESDSDDDDESQEHQMDHESDGLPPLIFQTIAIQ